jgi:hypothetical protein
MLFYQNNKQTHKTFCYLPIDGDGGGRSVDDEKFLIPFAGREITSNESGIE